MVSRRVLLVLAFLSCATPPPPVEAPKGIDFKAELGRLGEWIILTPYGRVWHPNVKLVGPDFMPYLTGGGWVHGADGWSFENDSDWGKVVFHYGRWFRADDLGWLWWPDQARAAAWVQWRAGDGYTGWSPLPPDVKNGRSAPQPWFFTKTKYLSAREATTFQLTPDEAARVQGVTQALPISGPTVEQVSALGGLDRDVQLPVVAPPEPVPEPVKEEAPPPPPKKKAKAKKKH